MLTRAYSVLEIKSVHEDERIVEGIATTIDTDRVGDVVEPKGALFKLPMPFLWQHDSHQPVGEVFAAKVTDAGILIKARILKIDEPGTLKNRLDEAWQSVKHGLVRGLSIGFQSMEHESIKGTFGKRFLKWMWLELSAVTIPANAAASIQAVKSFDAPHLAATGRGDARVHLSGASDSPRIRGTDMKKSIAERKQAFVAEKEAKVAKLNDLMGEDEGASLDDAGKESFDTIDREIKEIDDHLARLDTLERVNKAAARPVNGGTPEDASASRNPNPTPHVVVVRQEHEKGLGFARVAICKMAAYMSQGMVNPLDVAKQRFPHDERVYQYMKTAVAAGTTTDSVWAAPLVDQTTLESEFVEFLRPQTIVGKFGTDGIPPLRRLPFNVRIPTQTTGGSASWVGEGAPKPLTKFNFDAVTIPYTKVASIAVITKELARFSRPSAETIVRDQLAKAVIARMDTDFIDPDITVSSGVRPASITNGVTPLSSAGTSADNVRTDIQNLLESYILDNVDPTGLVLIMPNTLALVLSIMVNTLGQREFPNMTIRGGSLLGIPVIGSQYAANAGSAGNLIIAVNANDVGLADDGQVDVSVSGEASLNMDDAPTNNSATPTATQVVSMFQTNSLAILAERFVHWKKLRTNAVAYIDDANWGSIGSPS